MLLRNVLSIISLLFHLLLPDCIKNRTQFSVKSLWVKGFGMLRCLRHQGLYFCPPAGNGSFATGIGHVQKAAESAVQLVADLGVERHRGVHRAAFCHFLGGHFLAGALPAVWRFAVTILCS